MFPMQHSQIYPPIQGLLIGAQGWISFIVLNIFQEGRRGSYEGHTADEETKGDVVSTH
jgi:hypothetical protein